MIGFWASLEFEKFSLPISNGAGRKWMIYGRPFFAFVDQRPSQPLEDWRGKEELLEAEVIMPLAIRSMIDLVRERAARGVILNPAT
jgi:hypothetical protein